MTNQPTPADWAIELALEPVNASLSNRWTVDDVTRSRFGESLSFVCSILAHAAMIEKYEPHRKPVDPLLVEARKIMADYYREIWGADDLAAGCERGDWDDNGHVSTVITALRRGMELAREADHG